MTEPQFMTPPHRRAYLTHLNRCKVMDSYYIQIDHGGGLETLYAHCSSICVATGQQVQAGQVIGYVGHTGRAMGSHLHLETRANGTRVDSMQFFS